MVYEHLPPVSNIPPVSGTCIPGEILVSETVSDERLQEIGSHILPFSAEEGRLVEYAERPLTREELMAIPAEQLAAAAVSRMGEYAFLTRGLLNDRVFRFAPLTRGYKVTFWEAIRADSRVKLGKYVADRANTPVTICTSSSGRAILTDLMLLKDDVARLMTDRYSTARVPVSKVEAYANEQAEHRGLVWDARAREVFMNMYYTGGRGYPWKRSEPWRPPKADPVEQVEYAYGGHKIEQSYLRTHASINDLRDTKWMTYSSKEARAEETEMFSTVGEALDHFVSKFGDNVSIHSITSFVKYLCPTPGYSIDRSAFDALTVLLEKDDRFTKLGENTLCQCVYRLEVPGALDRFQINKLQALAPRIVEAAQAMGIAEPIHYADFLHKVLAELQVPLSRSDRSDGQMVRLALLVQADKRVVTTLSDKSGISMQVLPVRHRRRTRGGQEVNELAADDEATLALSALVETVAHRLDPDMLTVTQEYLLSHIRKLQPDLSPADESRLVALVSRHGSFEPRDEENSSFTFTAPNPLSQAHKNGAAPVAAPEFDGMGIIRFGSRRK